MIPDKKKKNMEVADEDSEYINGDLVRSMEILQGIREELERVFVCRTCGGAGFAEQLIFCKQCQVFAEHRYCLDEFPDIDTDFTWSCEECVPRVISSTNKVTLHPTRKSERITQKRKKRRDKKSSAAEVELQQHDIAFTKQCSELQTKDVALAPELQQYDVAFPQQPPELQTKVVPVSQELQHRDVAFTSELQTPVAPVPLIADSPLQSEESRSSYICEDTDGDHKRKRKRRKLVLEGGEISDEDTEYEQVEQMHIYPDVGMDPKSIPPVAFSVGDVPKCMLPVDSDVGDVAKIMLEVHSNTGDAPKSTLQVNNHVDNASKSLVKSHASAEVHTYVQTVPVIDPIWRGCFDISNGRYGRSVAHLTNKSCLKVWEGANALSSLPLLSAEMLSRLDAWPNSFADVAPTDDNIALYFFSESERDFENFDELVNEMIDLDLALKVYLHNAELLIFPSYQLPPQHWRFGGRYYLWGVFRGRKNSALEKSAEPFRFCDKTELVNPYLAKNKSLSPLSTGGRS